MELCVDIYCEQTDIYILNYLSSVFVCDTFTYVMTFIEFLL